MSAYRRPRSRSGSRSATPQLQQLDVKRGQTVGDADDELTDEDASGSSGSGANDERSSMPQRGKSPARSRRSSFSQQRRASSHSGHTGRPHEQNRAEALVSAAAVRGIKAAGQSAAAAAARVGSESDAPSGAPLRKPKAHRPARTGRLTPAEEAVLLQHFVPTMSDEFPELAVVADAIAAGALAADTSARMLGYWSGTDGPGSAAEAEYCPEAGHEALQQQHGQGQMGASLSPGGSGAAASMTLGSRGGSIAGRFGEVPARPSAAGASGSFAQEQQQSRQPRKSIAAVKLEQDLVLKACETAAMLGHRCVSKAPCRVQ